ncbi:MAG: patatin-like phospholipase family protein [Methyloceanibacter sp.]
MGPIAPGRRRSMAAIWRGLRRRNVFPIAWRTLLGLPFRRDFLVGSEGLRRLVHTHLPFRNLEDAAIPLHVVATNILSGEAVVLSAGSGADAILASTAIPAAFAPVQFGGRYLADGAITSCTPVRVAVEKGAKRLDRAADGLCLRPRSPTLWRHRQPLHALTLLIARQVTTSLRVSTAALTIMWCRRSAR